MSWVLLISLAAAPELHTLERLRAVKTVQARFRQAKTSPAFRRPLESEGRLYIAAPDKLRLEYQKPAATLIINGSQLLRSYPGLDTRQAIDTATAPELQSALGAMLPALRGDLERLRHQFSFHPDGAWLELRPKSEGLAKVVKTLRLRAHKTLPALAAIELQEPSGGRTQIEFFDIVIDAPLEDARFDASP